MFCICLEDPCCQRAAIEIFPSSDGRVTSFVHVKTHWALELTTLSAISFRSGKKKVLTGEKKEDSNKEIPLTSLWEIFRGRTHESIHNTEFCRGTEYNAFVCIVYLDCMCSSAKGNVHLKLEKKEQGKHIVLLETNWSH